MISMNRARFQRGLGRADTVWMFPLCARGLEQGNMTKHLAISKLVKDLFFLSGSRVCFQNFLLQRAAFMYVASSKYVPSCNQGGTLEQW